MNKIGIQQNKCLITLLFAMLLSVAAIPLHAQQDTLVTIRLADVPMSRVMDEIERQTNYLFMNQAVDVDQRVSVDVTSGTLRRALDQMVEHSDAEYRISGSNIILSKKAPQEGPVRVSGTVRDASGVPLAGATVFIAGTSAGAITGTDGTYSLTVPGGVADPRLEVNFLGYDPASATVGSRTTIDFTLAQSAVEMEQVVVTALGITRSEKALAYNVQEVASDDLTAIKDANFVNSLLGKVAGVTINSSSSGVGGAARVILRGAKSISQSSNALYVIDGIPMFNFGGGGGTEFDSTGATESIADLNPDDIESISVLTGASAAALYGSNASNGAIMITTKRGEAGTMKISVSSNNEFSSPFVLPDFQNRYGTGRSGDASRSPIQSWGPKLSEAAQRGYEPRDFFRTGFVTTNSVTLSGGSERNQTFFSAASVNSNGMVPNNRYNRYNFTFRNTTLMARERLKLDVGASYIIQNDLNMINQGQYSNPLVPAYLFPRGDDFSLAEIFERYDPARKIKTQYWPQGEGNMRIQNPYWIAYRNPRENDRKRYMLSAALSYKITDWLDLSGRVRVDNANNLYTQKLWASTNEVLTEGSKNGHYTEARRYDTQTYADVMANINKSFGRDWNLVANIGASINNTKSDELTNRGPIRENGLPNVFNVFDLDNQKKKMSKDGWQEQTQSIFASVEVGWRSQLYLTLTGRNDWASQLANSPHSSFFYPSVGVSWVPTSSFDMPKAFSYLKVRASFSSVGIPFPRYLTVPTYKYNDNTQSWETKTHYPIGDLYPERTRTYEAGVDARLWKKLSLSVSWYLADTYNQTFDPEISVSSGYSTIYLQTGRVRNTGIEANIGYSNLWGNFSWDTGLTFSWNRNEVVELVADYVHPETGETINKDRLQIKGLGKANYILRPGGTLGDLYSNSDLRRDDNNSVLIDGAGNLAVIDNLGDIRLGSVFPSHNLAWRNSFGWKGISIGAVISARIGGIVYSATRAYMDEYGVSEATAAARDAGGVVLNGRSTVDAQTYYTAISAQSGIPQYYTYSATNVRLQEASISYTLPRKLLGDVLSMTLSVYGRNLVMFYNKAPFDPESVASTDTHYQGIDYFMMPSARTVGCSVKLQF